MSVFPVPRRVRKGAVGREHKGHFKEKGTRTMATKEKLIACRRAYAEKGCKRIEIVHPDGKVSVVRNGIALAAAMGALVREADRQIASA